MDDPAADYATLPTYLLAKEAARHLKVVLCGEGGDELFAGYGRYRSALRSRWFGGRQMRRRGLLDGLGILRDRERLARRHRTRPSGASRPRAARGCSRRRRSIAPTGCPTISC